MTVTPTNRKLARHIGRSVPVCAMRMAVMVMHVDLVTVTLMSSIGRFVVTFSHNDVLGLLLLIIIIQ